MNQDIRCRECHNANNINNLVRACACEGPRLLVHIDCLITSFQTNGYKMCPFCKSPYTGIQIREKRLTFITYLCVKERAKRMSGSLLVTSFAFYTVYLGLFQYLQSRKILKSIWNIFLFFFITLFSTLFTLSSIYSLTSLYNDFRHWSTHNKKITVKSNNPEHPITLTKIIQISNNANA